MQCLRALLVSCNRIPVLTKTRHRFSRACMRVRQCSRSESGSLWCWRRWPLPWKVLITAIPSSFKMSLNNEAAGSSFSERTSPVTAWFSSSSLVKPIRSDMMYGVLSLLSLCVFLSHSARPHSVCEWASQKQWRNETEGGVTTTVNDRTIEIIRRLSIRSSFAKKRHGRHRKRIRDEQVNGALKQGEAREAHRLSRTLAGRGMGARRRPWSRIPAIRLCSEERAKHPQTADQQRWMQWTANHFWQ